MISGSQTSQWVIAEQKPAMGSPFPSDDWRKPEFDDHDWIRHPGPFSAAYRSLALIGLRGRFQVTDPARAGDLSLVVKFQGGVAAYVNGQEVGRAFLPASKLANDTLAQEYPVETYLTAKGAPLPEPDRDRGTCTAATGNFRKCLAGTMIWSAASSSADARRNSRFPPACCAGA